MVEYERSLKMTEIDFISSLGGVFGLFLGFSLITFVFYISREKQKFSRSEVEGGKVGRLDVGKIGRFEGGKARKNLRKVAVGSSLPSSLLIPSTIPSLYLPHKNFSLVTFGHQSSTKYTALMRLPVGG